MRLHVSVNEQKMRVSCEESAQVIDREYEISTSLNGVGSEEGSYKTPQGRFRIEQKIGANAPLYTNFKGRQPRYIWSPDNEESDAILSRIVRLEGCEQVNNNSWDRYIYIHGTHEEQLIGTPASHGCIRMKNADMVELFDQLPLGADLIITQEAFAENSV